MRRKQYGPRPPGISLGGNVPLDTPDRLRDLPANLFTGTFIGEPPMNVFSAEAVAESGEIAFQLGGGVRLAYPETSFEPRLRADLLARRAVTVGIRPYAVRIAPDGIEAEVLANQWLGDQTHIAARFADGAVVSVEHHRAPYAVGEAIGISITAEHLHIFDTSTGAAISHGGELAEVA